MSFQMGLIRKGKILDIDSNICMFVIHEKRIPDQKCKSIGTDIVKLTGERCVGIFQRDGTWIGHICPWVFPAVFNLRTCGKLQCIGVGTGRRVGLYLRLIPTVENSDPFNCGLSDKIREILFSATDLTSP